jgi:pilus assembly protein CpaB
MNTRSLLTILFGTALAGGASFLVMNFADTGAGAAEAFEVPMQEVVVALSEIEFGQVIESHMLATQSWPRDAVPMGVYLDKDAIFEGDEPRRALGHFFAGEPVFAAKVSRPGERVTIVQKLTPGHRAMAIRVDAETAVGGFVTPGDFVDIVMTQGGGNDMRAVTVLQNVRVVGIDQVSAEQMDQPMVARTITVEVTPGDGQKLALAQRAGQLSLTLRDLEASEIEAISQIDLDDLFDAPQPEPEPIAEDAPVEAAPAVDTRPRVIVRRGIQAEEVIIK